MQIAAQAGDIAYVRVRDGVGNTSAIATADVPGEASRVYLPLVFRNW